MKNLHKIKSNVWMTDMHRAAIAWMLGKNREEYQVKIINNKIHYKNMGGGSSYWIEWDDSGIVYWSNFMLTTYKDTWRQIFEQVEDQIIYG